MPAPAPSQRTHCLVRSSASSAFSSYSTGAYGRKGKGAAKRGRAEKDERPSISSGRSSSVSPCRTSIASMTPSTRGLAALREHQSAFIISTSGLMGDVPLTRSRSDLFSQRRSGTKAPSPQGWMNDLGYDIRARSSFKSFSTLHLGVEEENHIQRAIRRSGASRSIGTPALGTPKHGP